MNYQDRNRNNYEARVFTKVMIVSIAVAVPRSVTLEASAAPMASPWSASVEL